MKTPERKTSVMFGQQEVSNGDKMKVPQHHIVDAIGRELPQICLSTTGVVVFTGGVPDIVPIVKCDREGKRFKVWKNDTG